MHVLSVAAAGNFVLKFFFFFLPQMSSQFYTCALLFARLNGSIDHVALSYPLLRSYEIIKFSSDSAGCITFAKFGEKDRFRIEFNRYPSSDLRSDSRQESLLGSDP